MSKSGLSLKIENEIAFLILDNPPKNQMDDLFFDTLNHLCKNELPRKQYKGIIVYGSGRHFSSGADIQSLATTYKQKDISELKIKFSNNLESLTYLETLQVPVVAAISGCCLGSGLELALACHVRVAAERSVFALPESGYGIIPGCGGTIRLPKLIGSSRSFELILSGRTVLADEAFEIGLIDVVVKKNDLLLKAIEIVTNRNKHEII